ncbi:MAG: YggT family protein [Alphaproteobacteria bacterium]|nr:YggT family protein [Alphaproteobacteria bacterium]
MPEPLIRLLLLILDLYWWVVVIAVIVSWLIAFGIINVYNQVARSVVSALDALTEPVFRRVRKVVPPVGGLDLSPLIVLIGIWFLQQVIVWLAIRVMI